MDCKTVGLFLKVSKEIGKACRKSLTREARERACEAREKKRLSPGLALCFKPRSRPFVWLLARTWIRKNTDCFAVYCLGTQQFSFHADNFAPLFCLHLSVHQIVFLHSYLLSSVMACRLFEWFPEKPWWYSLSCFWLISTFATLLVVFVPTPVNKPATFNGHNLIPRVLSYPSLRSEKAERGRQEKEPGNEVVLVVFSTYMENPFYNQHSHSYFHIQINLVRTLARS